MRKIIVLEHISMDGTIPAAFKVTESIVGSSGVIVVNYERAGEVRVRSA